MFIGTGRDYTPLAKRVTWLLLAIMAGLAAWIAMRGYLSPELLMYFANSFTC